MAISHPQFTIVFIDLEATGLSVTDEIIQIGAKCGDREFSQYIIPTSTIPKKITVLTGISMADNQMFYKGEKVSAVSSETAINNFFTFLRQFHPKPILVAHNCFNFDGPMLAGLIDEIDEIHMFKSIVAGFSDTFPLLKKSLPQKRDKGEGYNLKVLAKEFLGDASRAHDALADATMLEKLISLPSVGVTANDIVNSRQIVGAMTHKYKNRLNSYRQLCRYEDNNCYWDDSGDEY